MIRRCRPSHRPSLFRAALRDNSRSRSTRRGSQDSVGSIGGLFATAAVVNFYYIRTHEERICVLFIERTQVRVEIDQDRINSSAHRIIIDRHCRSNVGPIT